MRASRCWVLRTLGWFGKAALFIWLGASLCLAQSNLASISGVVTDPQGAAVPQAAVSILNTATGVHTATTTNSAGFYAVPNLPVGSYSMTVDHTGFRRYVRQGIVLNTGQTLGLDVRLQLGAINQTISVTGAEPLVQTRTSDIGNVVTSQSVEALPLANRRTLNLVELSGAAVFVKYSSIIGNANPDFSLAGGRTQSQMAWLDGADIQNMRIGLGQINLDPPVQAVQEVKVLENNYSAQYGGSADGVIVETTKSGTNQFHGSAYEYFRNDALDAAGFFAPVKNGQKLKPELRYNLFGATLGGPIQHDKTFFFFSYEGGRLKQGATDTLTVPTVLQRSGDFSQTFNAKGQLIPIYDPSSTRVVNGSDVRTQFARNVIPTADLDPVALKVVSYYPLPNLPSLTGGNNFAGNYVQGTSGNFYLIKGDHAFGDKDRISGWYVSDDTSPNNTSVFPVPAADSQNFSINNIHYVYASWFHILSPTQVNDLAFDYNYRVFHNLSFGLGGDYPSKLGLKGVPENAFPKFAPAGYAQLGSNQQERRQYPIGATSFQDNFSWVRGRHALKFGGQITKSTNDDLLLNSVSGAFTFSTQPTGQPGNATTGNGLASLLTGFPTDFTELATEELDRYSYYLAAFAQDDWTVKTSLTLNLGLRWETDTPIRDSNNRMSGFDPTEINPVSGTPGVVKFMGLNGWPLSPYGGRWNNLGPRFGFAWKPFHSGRTVVRGGYGVFYAHPFDEGVPDSAALGFSVSANLVSPDNGITAPFYLRNGVPVSATAPTLNDSFGAVPVGKSPNTAVTFYEQNRPTGTSQQFNLGVERQLPGNMMIEITGLGNLGRNLPNPDMSINQITPSVLGPKSDTQAFRPYPQFSSVMVLAPPLGISNYYAGMVRIEKRFSHGLTFQANYTYSNFLDNSDHGGAVLGNQAGYSNFYDRAADYGPSANRVTHHLVFDWVYELPFGAGKRWLSSSPLRYLAGGWRLGNVTTIQSGSPFTVTALTNTTNSFSAGSLRPNIIQNPDLPAGQRSISRWFNTDAFSQPAAFEFGNEGVGILQGPGYVDFDFSLMRSFHLTERARLEFRGEFFNMFNRTNLDIPGATFGAPSFGVINSSGPARVIQLGAEVTF